jgi:hypothetical protein
LPSQLLPPCRMSLAEGGLGGLVQALAWSVASCLVLLTRQI